MNIKKIAGLAKYLLLFKNKIKKKNYKYIKEKKFSIILDNLNKNGYYVIPQYFSQKDCFKIQKEMKYKFNTLKKRIKLDKKKSDHRLWASEKYIKSVVKFNRDKFIKKISEEFMQTKMSVLCTLANKVIYKRNNLGSGGGWHRDNYNPEFKAILYLSDVKKNNGPFQFIENSHKVRSIFKDSLKLSKYYPDTTYKNSDINKVSKNKKIITIIGKPGTLLLLNTRMIHRGMPIKEDSRFALTNYYFPVEIIKEQRKKISKHLTN